MKPKIAISLAGASLLLCFFLINCTKTQNDRNGSSVPEMLSPYGGGGGMSSEDSSLLQKMAAELDVPAHNTLCSLYNLGSFNIDSAIVDSISEFPGARFTKIPVYKNNVLMLYLWA